MNYTDLAFATNVTTNTEASIFNNDAVSRCYTQTLFAPETDQLPDEVIDMVNRFCDVKRNEFARKCTITESPQSVVWVVVPVLVGVILTMTSPPVEFKPVFDDPNNSSKI
ncbi:MAG: hypothetical protein LBJ67_01350 [Planctomycetaceae bacterium]|nr:hypothetical protein [Planctomycetaceae bacterium]